MRGTAVIVTGALWALLACSDAAPPPERPGERPDEPAATGAAVDARYLTTYAFVSAGAQGPQLYAHLLNETSPAYLVRDYGAWLVAGEGRWQELLSVRDTLPVPRAAWRTLPAPGLRLLVGDDGETMALLLGERRAEVRLRPESPLAEWTGATGQREYLAPARLSAGGEVHQGLLFFRRAASLWDRDAGLGPDQVFLLADSAGAAVLVAGSAEQPLGSLTAWTWLDGVQGTWTDVVLRRHGDGQGEHGQGAWVLELSEAGLAGRIWSVADARPGRPVGPPAPGGPAAEVLEGELETPDATRRLRGLLLRAALP